MNPKGLRGKSITPKMLAQIEQDLSEGLATKAVAEKYGLSVKTVQNLNRARKTPPIPVKAVIKNI